MFLKRKQTAPQYGDEEEENQYNDAEQEPIEEEEEELNDDELNALYEEEQVDNSEQQQDNADEMDDDEEDAQDEEESSSEDEKTLSFAERLALSNMKPKSNFKTSSNDDSTHQNRHRHGKQHHTPTKKRVEKDEKSVIERKNKNAPKEVSSKIRPRTIPDIAKRLGYVKKKSRDPRFDPTANDTDPSSFKQFSGRYNHVFEQLKDEIDENREKLRDKSLSYEERNDIQREISRLQTRNKKFETQKAIAEVKDSFYKREKKLISDKGKQAYFLKDSDVKKILKERKVEGIKKSGKMNKFIKKTKRKDKSKVAALMPLKRRE